MRTFLVIKEYPRSPELNYKLDFNSDDKDAQDENGYGITLGECISDTEFFEEITQLENAYNRQVELQELMQANGFNIVNCNGKDCNNVLIHESIALAEDKEEEIIVCPCCGYENYPNDCSDVYYPN